MPSKNPTKEQIAKWNKTYYAKNREKRVEITRQNREKLKKYVEEYKLQHPCHCGESSACCLDFHHRNGNDKELDISLCIHRGWSIKRLSKEIEKCDILCANCHRKLHYNERLEPKSRTTQFEKDKVV